MIPPRIYKVSYRGSRRVAQTLVKVQYGGMFGMTELLTRMLATGQILWFRVSVAKSSEIAEHRAGLERWLPALENTSSITGVDWTT